MAQYREEGAMRGLPIPLLSAEGELTLWFKPKGGRRSDIIFQFTNPILSGNTSGLTTNFRVPWKRAIEFAKGIKEIGRMLREGQGLVDGFAYGPVKLDLNPLCYMRVFLTPDDCDTIAHSTFEAVQKSVEK